MQIKKFFCAFYFTAVFSCFLYSDPEIIKLNYLVNGDWGQEYSNIGVQIKFYNNYKCDIDINYGMDYEQKKGVFSIKDECLLTIYSTDKKEILYEEGRMSTDPESPIYQKYIYFLDDTTIWNKKTTLKPDTKLTIDGNKVISMGFARGKILSNIKFRVAPDTKAETIPYERIKTGDPDGMPDTELIPYVPEGIEVTVFARTEKKIKVNDWNNYWYFVYVRGEMSFVGKKGWMYAEFVEIIE